MDVHLLLISQKSECKQYKLCVAAPRSLRTEAPPFLLLHCPVMWFSPSISYSQYKMAAGGLAIRKEARQEVDIANLKQFLLRAFPQVPYNILLTSYWTEISHMAMCSRMGGWEMQSLARYIVFLNKIWTLFGGKREENSSVYHKSFLCRRLLLILLEISLRRQCGIDTLTSQSSRIGPMAARVPGRVTSGCDQDHLRLQIPLMTLK